MEDGLLDGPNLYAYVRQNPWTHWDPLGLMIPSPVALANTQIRENTGIDVLAIRKEVSGFVGDTLHDWGSIGRDPVGSVGELVDQVWNYPGNPMSSGGKALAAKAVQDAPEALTAGKNLLAYLKSLVRGSGAPPRTKAEILKESYEKGKAFEPKVVEAAKQTQENVVEQLRVVTNEGGTPLVLDVVGKSKTTGTTVLTEAKSSATAGFTKNQRKGFPEAAQSGVTVTGSGKPGYPPGTVIPPTKVEVVRPADLEKR